MNPLQALFCKDRQVFLNLRRLAREQSRFKILFVLAFGLGLLAGLWGLFYSGFHSLSAMGGIGVLIIRHLFALFYFGLGLMLILSNIITAYTTLYRSEEIPFLLLRPVSHGEIILHKLAETALISSWAFFCIIIPFIGAFAMHERLSFWFILWTLLLSAPFVVLCSELGMLITLLAVRWIPRFRPMLWAGAFLLAAAVWAYIQFRPVIRLESNDISFLLSRLVPGIRLTSFPFWPSWWVAEGILSLARDQWVRGLLFCGVLTANVLVVGLALKHIGQACFFTGWLKTQTSPRRDRSRHGLLDRFERRFSFLAPDCRALIFKDLRLLVRDPVQWTQGFLFFGLLGLYFFNLRNLHYDLLSPVWLNLIAFLNMFSLSAIMCSFCSRFVYPQLSLEGQGFWLLGLSPMSMGRVLAIKFALALIIMLVISLMLMAVSAAMLKVAWSVQLTGLMIAAATSAALCGLATGLGAVFLNLKQRNPMAIVSGFGGTLNLALSLGYMIAAILPFGLLYHAFTMDQLSEQALRRGWILAALWLLVITAVTTITPLAAGRKSLLAREY
ncbi:MAG: hypothetical protein KKG09_10385 [Verrucomicrobia bacterium]|nr:hypothetical protein [Verrucomicrobiota bacterium]MCG2681830.1 hypothetical protein [Kiritimatiellia bacterium]MBU4247712.1 hypothetical protein [Verrucomicrobiota bacterium]MBU4291637.1 hypothetical protein [Verrucomicrobiota bacterium]MBU4429546.1 hypothetical protein [Verrucomicrobiota bacterium]